MPNSAISNARAFIETQDEFGSFDSYIWQFAPDAPPSRPRSLADIPVTVGRSGLILVLTGQPGTANVIGQAIDESTFTEQVGTVAGDNTLIVLFPDESALERWLERFDALQLLAEPVMEATPR